MMTFIIATVICLLFYALGKAESEKEVKSLKESNRELQSEIIVLRSMK